MKTLKGDFERREEIERKLKASHDGQIFNPFPEEDEEIEEDAQNAQIENDAELAK